MGFKEYSLRFIWAFVIFFSLLMGQDSIESSDLHTKGEFNLWHLQCKKRDYNACYLLGVAYKKGYEVLPNDKKAGYFLSLACQKDIAKACVILSSMASDTSGKLDLYKKACDLDDLESCNKLANILLDSNIESDKQTRYSAIKKACKLSGDSKCEKANASYTLGVYSADSIKECEIAAAEGSDTTECGKVGDSYANGINVSRDKQKAKYYYGLACKSNVVYCYKEELDSVLNP